jgi:hypothetical protein
MLNSPADQSAVTGRRLAHRSRVTNGHALLPSQLGVDGRSAWVRRCKDLITDHLSDLGGQDNCSVAERSIVRRAAVITTELEMLEAKFAIAGHATNADLETYQRTANTLRRLLVSLGLQRRVLDVTSTQQPVIDELTNILGRLQEVPP